MMEGATQLEPSWNTSNPQKVISKGGWVGITGTKLSVTRKDGIFMGYVSFREGTFFGPVYSLSF